MRPLLSWLSAPGASSESSKIVCRREAGKRGALSMEAVGAGGCVVGAVGDESRLRLG